MRIISLVPAATEILAELGAADQLVGISHECDYPAAIRDLPRVTTTVLDTGATSRQIDARLRAEGTTTIVVAAEEIRSLRPDLIVTQALCEVCAVSEGAVRRLADALKPAPEIITLAGRTIAGVIYDILRLGEHLATNEARDQAERLTNWMEDRLTTIRERAQSQRHGEPPPRVLTIEWVDPVFLAGHWVPELVDFAGGVDVGAEPGAHSREVTLEELDGFQFNHVFVIPCGFDIKRARHELDHSPQVAAWLRQRRVPITLMDANSYTSRPGPRLVDGATIMAAAITGGRHDGFQTWQ
ncbi:MAG: ABC transporter substrate-binding protein [Longimicrobiales bacterium]